MPDRTPSTVAAALAALLLLACGGGGTPDRFQVDPSRGSAHLSARPAPPTAPAPDAARGFLTLVSNDAPRGVLYVPSSYRPDVPAPLVLVLHGGYGQGRALAETFQARADAAGALLLAPDSAFQTWDLVMGAFRFDREFIDEVLADTFRQYNVDPARVGALGFSDGASYALSLGLANGELFHALAAYSPGFVITSELQGRPRIYLSHGRQDGALPFEECGALIARELEALDYDLTFNAFDGGHQMPTAAKSAGFALLTGG